MENRIGREAAVKIHEVIVEKFIASFKTPPKKLILDFDATDDVVHGEQVNRFFHSYYDHYCFLPLYVFCGEQLLVSYLRPSKIEGAKHTRAILSLLVKRLRKAWPSPASIQKPAQGLMLLMKEAGVTVSQSEASTILTEVSDNREKASKNIHNIVQAIDKFRKATNK